MPDGRVGRAREFERFAQAFSAIVYVLVRAYECAMRVPSLIADDRPGSPNGWGVREEVQFQRRRKKGRERH